MVEYGSMNERNNAALEGNITHDLTLQKHNDRSFVNFTIAVNKRYTDKEGNEQEIVSFIPVTAWGQVADGMEADGLGKGSLIKVTGEIRSRHWETEEGEKRSRVYVQCSSCEPQTAQQQTPETTSVVLPPTPAEEIDPADIPFD